MVTRYETFVHNNYDQQKKHKAVRGHQGPREINSRHKYIGNVMNKNHLGRKRCYHVVFLSNRKYSNLGGSQMEIR